MTMSPPNATKYKNLFASRTFWSSFLQYLLVLVPFTLEHFSISIDDHEGLQLAIGLGTFIMTSYFRLDTKAVAFTPSGFPGRNKPRI